MLGFIGRKRNEISKIDLDLSAAVMLECVSQMQNDSTLQVSVVHELSSIYIIFNITALTI